MELSCWERFYVFLCSRIIPLILTPIFGPLKVLTSFCTFLRNKCRRRNSPERHAEKVAHVQKQVLDWVNGGKSTKLCTARPAWQTLSIRTAIYKSSMTGIHIDLDDIIEIDTAKMVVLVEPMMTMGRLSAELLPRGWTIPVLPELNDLLVGGLACGTGIETSSHKHGLFQSICVSYEVVLASGEVVTCSKEKHSDLFYAMPFSSGTLGFVTSVGLRIIPARKYVKLQYMPAHSLDEAISTFTFQTNRESGNDFVEGIMFGLNEGVIMVGEMTDEVETGKVNSIGLWYKIWFYKHVKTFLRRNSETRMVEYIPLRQYYHRHERGIFWEMESIFPPGNNIVFRYLFGWALPMKISRLKRFAPQSVLDIFDKFHITQDFLVPLEKLKDALLLTHEEVQVYPMWLCPCKIIKAPGVFRLSGLGDEMYVDFGVYGETKQKHFELIKSTRALELFSTENRGFQLLYSDVFLSREEFGEMFDLTHYEQVRKDYNCLDAFPHFYDKVKHTARR